MGLDTCAVSVPEAPHAKKEVGALIWKASMRTKDEATAAQVLKINLR